MTGDQQRWYGCKAVAVLVDTPLPAVLVGPLGVQAPRAAAMRGGQITKTAPQAPVVVVLVLMPALIDSILRFRCPWPAVVVVPVYMAAAMTVALVLVVLAAVLELILLKAVGDKGPVVQ